LAKWCRERGYGLIHENLKGIRGSANKRIKKLNRFNGKIQEISIGSRKFKRGLNSWWFRRFLNMVNYKCLWFGVRTKPVNPRGSSSKCPRCGSKLKEYPMGHVKCLRCKFEEDRHIVACLNMLKRTSDVSLWFRLERPSNVAMSCALTSGLNPVMRISTASKRGEGNYTSPEELPEPPQLKG